MEKQSNLFGVRAFGEARSPPSFLPAGLRHQHCARPPPPPCSHPARRALRHPSSTQRALPLPRAGSILGAGSDLEGGGEEAISGQFPRLRGSPAARRRAETDLGAATSREGERTPPTADFPSCVGRRGGAASGRPREGEGRCRRAGWKRTGGEKLGKPTCFSLFSATTSFFSFLPLGEATPFGGACSFWSFLLEATPNRA